MRFPTMSPDGWVSFLGDDDDIQIHMKIAMRDDDVPGGLTFRRPVPVSILIESEREITSDVLAKIKPARFVAQLIEFAEGTTNLADLPDDSILARLGTTDDGMTTFDDLRDRLAERLALPFARAKPKRRRRLGRPDGSDAFYRKVAEAYVTAVMETSKPAVLLSDENDVPVETVRRWIKEARRRGHLTPGQKGRAV